MLVALGKIEKIFFWAGFIFSGPGVVREGYGRSGGPRPNFYWKFILRNRSMMGVEIRVVISAVDGAENRLD